ncbi:hypothetical protein ACWEQ2_45270 [Streptomyces sp. NPDC004096]
MGYSRTPEVAEQRLCNRCLGTDTASRDRILGSSTAVTGSLFFTPFVGFLDDMSDLQPYRPSHRQHRRWGLDIGDPNRNIVK